MYAGRQVILCTTSIFRHLWHYEYRDNQNQLHWFKSFFAHKALTIVLLFFSLQLYRRHNDTGHCRLPQLSMLRQYSNVVAPRESGCRSGEPYQRCKKFGAQLADYGHLRNGFHDCDVLYRVVVPGLCEGEIRCCCAQPVYSKCSASIVVVQAEGEVRCWYKVLVSSEDTSSTQTGKNDRGITLIAL